MLFLVLLPLEPTKILKWSIALTLASFLIILYKFYNPSEYIYFPKCPLKFFTGIKCPGCGSQRAVHRLLNFEIINAARENLMLVLSVPYILTGFVFDVLKKSDERFLKWRKIIFGQKAIYIILSTVFAFWILRNII